MPNFPRPLTADLQVGGIYDLDITASPIQPLQTQKNADGRLICNFPACNDRVFACSNTLSRHRREVHNMNGGPREKFFCRFPGACNRKTERAFGRKYNRDNHEKSIHKESYDTPRLLQTHQVGHSSSARDSRQAGGLPCTRCGRFHHADIHVNHESRVASNTDENFQTVNGVVEESTNIVAPSQALERKRGQNACASARSRARRKERENTLRIMVRGLQQQNKKLKEMLSSHRREQETVTHRGSSNTSADMRGGEWSHDHKKPAGDGYICSISGQNRISDGLSKSFSAIDVRTTDAPRLEQRSFTHAQQQDHTQNSAHRAAYPQHSALITKPSQNSSSVVEARTRLSSSTLPMMMQPTPHLGPLNPYAAHCLGKG
ncbi:hypothetical protein KVT40_002260 [Elsinoe batatas]|uniref:BZIP domain-containing protein n=1 Tax=Elsinoe batatas TaxID=2601811 RepID=A0A8K0L650_9PEZI|nr:hypothetical protein KVT40_002260 [Elsinoe batatas]